MVLAVDDDLVALLAVVRGHRDRGRRTPADLGVPFRAPQFLARAAVEGGDEGRRALLLLDDDQPVAVEQRRRRRAVEGAQCAERLVPDDLAVHVQRQQPVVPEVRVDALAVRRRRGGGVAVLGVGAFRVGGGRRRGPEACAGRPVEGEHGAFGAVRLGGGQEDLVSPDDRRGVAVARNGDLPADVLLRPPAVDVAGAGDVALAARPAPARPGVGGISRGGRHLRSVVPGGEGCGEAGERQSDRDEDAPRRDARCARRRGGLVRRGWRVALRPEMRRVRAKRARRGGTRGCERTERRCGTHAGMIEPAAHRMHREP